MKKIYFLLLGLLVLCSCTQHDGYLGPLYGSWSLTEISEGNVSLPLDGGPTEFSFQSEVIQVTHLVDYPLTTVFRYGNFTHNDKQLVLKFQAAPTAQGSYLYVTPDWLYFPQNGEPISFDVKELNGKRMILELKTDGKILTYSFIRTW